MVIIGLMKSLIIDNIRFRESVLNNTQNVAAWFRKKIEIGLERHQYAKGN
ncbi:MAG: hypothetical protein ACI9Y7_000512 [Dokdonia sp.]